VLLQTKLAISASFLYLAVLVTCGCGPSVNSSQGFTLQTSERLAAAGCSSTQPCPPAMLGPRQPYPGISVIGDCENAINLVTGEGAWCQPGPDIGGSVTTFSETTQGENAQAYVSNGMAPAVWNLFATWTTYCGEFSLYEQGTFPGTINTPFWEYEFPGILIENLGTEYIDCTIYQSSGGGGGEPSASTRFAIMGDFPDSITLGSQTPFTTQNGMPQLYVYNGTPAQVAVETATSVDPSGATATFPFPSGLSQNGYSLAVVNQMPGGTIYPASVNLLSIASSQTISGNPFGVAAGGLTENSTYCKPLPPIRGEPQQYSCTTTNLPYEAFPIVSLFSQNQVLVQGRTPINVGPNPSAIASYQGESVTQYLDNGLITNTYTGTTRAAVANSGSNTISILDTVNNVVLGNVTVGNQPVALAVSPTFMAYVANYTDRTVTQVNLNTLTPTATIAVGGNPTSVALTASGILWVGGVGFLTEINTSNMSVVATESSSRTISALGYTDAYNELVATSSDGSGNVYVDAVSPSSVTAGGVYTPAASQSVSTLGTFFNPRIQAQSFGFTGTLTSSLVPISTAQVGAPPLVVQDGWAVITATPTGFTITDASGNIVLVSETTPSPIAGIAVDSNLSQAYLTMPDSNTLLTVPLPGTGTN
jgi:YVTN family beta-propeller protein